MLTVPATIQSLFKDDGILKNFRVHFPNGENADLTNADIVSGSVKFTESVSSKDVLQFGLAESPRIEFECVNVPNIYGMTIECGIEVDTSSLSAAQITAIQGNPGDGTLVLVGDSDIGYGFYRVPYGVFTVRSCPRSAGAMWKRRVEAYAKDTDDSLTIYKTTQPMDNVNPFMYLIMKENSLCGIPCTTSSGSPSSIITLSDSLTITSGITLSYSSAPADTMLFNDIYRFTCVYDDTCYNTAVNAIETYGGDLSSASVIKFLNKLKVPEDSGYRWALVGTQINWIKSVPHLYLDVHGTVTDLGAFTITSNMSVTLYTLDEPYKSTTISLENVEVGGIYQLALTKIPVEHIYEVMGKMRKTKRTGEYTTLAFSKSNPIHLSPDEYMELWWDEYDVSPIGYIRFNHIEADEEVEYEYDTGTGLSVYDMTENYVIKHLTNPNTYADICTFLDSVFIPNIQDIAFTPVQLDALGLPYLEAGDYLEIDDGNSGTVGTYIMNRTISGEQFLEDEIESQGGEIIGNARNA